MMSPIKILLSLILVSLLSGCFAPKEKIVVKTQNVYAAIVCPDPQKPQPIRTKPINPKAIQDQAGIWWVGLSPDEYGNLAINTQETIRFIKDKNGDIEYYKKCIIDFNTLVEKKNASDKGEDTAPTTQEVLSETSEEE